MIRSDVLKTLIPLISDELVVTNIGLPSQEMHLLDDQPSNFYMLGTMGLASSIGLGLALAQDKKVIAIDGDRFLTKGINNEKPDPWLSKRNYIGTVYWAGWFG